MSLKSTVSIFDTHMSFKQAAEFERTEVDVPDTVIDFFEANVFARAHDRDVDPVATPSDTAIGADIANFEAIRIFECGESVRHKARRGLIT